MDMTHSSPRGVLWSMRRHVRADNEGAGSAPTRAARRCAGAAHGSAPPGYTAAGAHLSPASPPGAQPETAGVLPPRARPRPHPPAWSIRRSAGPPHHHSPASVPCGALPPHEDLESATTEKKHPDRLSSGDCPCALTGVWSTAQLGQDRLKHVRQCRCRAITSYNPYKGAVRNRPYGREERRQAQLLFFKMIKRVTKLARGVPIWQLL